MAKDEAQAAELRTRTNRWRDAGLWPILVKHPWAPVGESPTSGYEGWIMSISEKRLLCSVWYSDTGLELYDEDDPVFYHGA